VVRKTGKALSLSSGKNLFWFPTFENWALVAVGLSSLV